MNGYLCNTNRKRATGPVTVEVKASGNVQLWDAETGKRCGISADSTPGAVSFSTSMPPTGSRLFVITPRGEDLSPTETLREVRAEAPPADGWSAQRTEPNVLVLDMVRYRVGSGEVQGPVEILKADGAIRDALGIPQRGGQMVQPWARPKRAERPSTSVELRYAFEVAQMPRGPLALALEDPTRFEIEFNGTGVPREAECGWWTDLSIRLLPLDVSDLAIGPNEIVLRGTFDEDANLEAMFLLGDFAVSLDGDRARMERGTEVSLGDWTEQGLPFYAGAVAFRQEVPVNLAEGQRVFVEVPDFRGACVRVLVDGIEAGVIAWQPHEVDVTELARGKSELELTVEVIGHRRNAFGPLHHVEKWPRWTGPGTYVSTGREWQDEYNIVPCGCLSSPKLSYREEA